MTRFNCAIVPPMRSTGSACVMSVGTGESMWLLLRLQQRNASLLLFDLRDLLREIRDARTLLLDYRHRGVGDEARVGELGFGSGEILSHLRFAFCEPGELDLDVVDQCGQWRMDRVSVHDLHRSWRQ